MNLRAFVFIMVLMLLCATLMADPRSGFDEGLRCYRANDMPGAIAAWESVAQQGSASGQLLYNLGNAYYRAGKIGKAVLCYERAKKLLPRDRDVEGNLEIARLGIVDKIDSPVRLIIWNWVDRIRDFLTVRELAILLYLFGFAASGLLLMWRVGPYKLRAMARTCAVVAVVLYMIVGGWYGWRAALDGRPFAVVTAVKSDIYSAPDSAAQQLFALHEGTKVRCGESLSGWMNIRLADGRKGWIALPDLEKL